jgi:hypothetical protein
MHMDLREVSREDTKVKVTLSLSTMQHYPLKPYGGVKVYLHIF